MSKTLLQDVAEEISFDKLPIVWQNFDLTQYDQT